MGGVAIRDRELSRRIRRSPQRGIDPSRAGIDIFPAGKRTLESVAGVLGVVARDRLCSIDRLMMRLPPKFMEINSGKVEEAIDAHTIQPYYTVMLADEIEVLKRQLQD